MRCGREELSKRIAEARGIPPAEALAQLNAVLDAIVQETIEAGKTGGSLRLQWFGSWQVVFTGGKSYGVQFMAGKTFHDAALEVRPTP